MTNTPASRRGRIRAATCLAICLASASLPVLLQAQTVRAVLFHSPTCPHCRQVISQDLPIFFQVYGGEPRLTEGGRHLALASNGQLEILFVDASQPSGGALYEASMASHPVSRDRMGVPRMIIDDSVLVGSFEIPNRLHALIRGGLADGGIDWPEIPGLAEVVAELERAGLGDTGGTADSTGAAEAAGVGGAGRGGEAGVGGARPSTDAAAPAESAAPRPVLEDLGTTQPASVAERFARDPTGNGLAVGALVLMVVVVGAVLAGTPRRIGPRDPGIWLPLLIVAGAAVSGYLTYVETTGTAAVCGPVGDCNTVQQSPYATLFGVIPVGLLGLIGYGLMLVLWVLGLEGRPTSRPARRALVAATIAGAAFSIYLTFLEPFVIGATCLWCLSSAIVVTVLAWLSTAWTLDTSPP